MLKGSFIFLMTLCFFLGFAQFDDTEKYVKEFIWGVTTNTNSSLIGGAVFRYGRSHREDIFETFGIELVNVAHPSEQKYTSSQNGSSFIWGKQNRLLAVRGQYGRDKIIYGKESQKGVQINANIALGPTIGIVIPYYVLTSGGEYVVYDPKRYTNLQSIQGSGKFLQGLGESKIIPGINIKAALIFEFGSFMRNVIGIEFGGMAESYVKQIIIVPTKTNTALYASAFFTFFWGKRIY